MRAMDRRMHGGTLKLKAQLLRDGEIALGPGKADLLDAIDREGSISAAGRALGMSYRRSWLLVDSMNRCFASPLVEARRGSGQASGARLTENGRIVLAAYRTLEHDIARAAAAGGARLAAMLATDGEKACTD
jgi:molybdate transport system regulatory protein